MSYAYGDPPAKITGYSFDAVGNLLTKTDAFSPVRTTTNLYDAGNQLTSIAYSDGVTPNVAMGYDALGRRSSMSDGSGSSAFGYDSLGRLTSSSNGAGASIGFAYDLKGQLTSLIYPASTGTVTRGYDDAGRLTSILDWLSPGTRTPFTYTYDPNSNLTHIAYPNGDAVDMPSYDKADQLLQINHFGHGGASLLSLAYTPDQIGLTTAEGSKGYAYDGINRVQTATTADTRTYGYDNADRLTQIAVTGGNTTTLAYDNSDQLNTFTVMNGPTQVQKYTYQYDNNGNRTKRTDQGSLVLNYGFDMANRMTSFSGNSHTASYAYNGDGLRMSKTVDSTTTSDAWQLADGLPVIIREVAGANTSSYVTGPNGLPLEQISGTTSYYFHANKLGSTRILTEAAGNQVQSYDYDAYGNLISSSGSIANPFQFAGQLLDPEGALSYLRARYYDPASAQFSSRDAITAITRQPYVYAHDTPANATDPSGLWCAGMDMASRLSLGSGSGASVRRVRCKLLTARIGRPPSSAISVVELDPGSLRAHSQESGFNGFYSRDAKSLNDLAGPFDTVSIGGGIGDAIELQASSGATANEVGLAVPFLPCGAGIGFGALAVPTTTKSVARWRV